MAEEKLDKENLIKPYRSIEQRVLEDSGVNEFIKYTGKATYGIIASMFRIPTSIRKIVNEQTFVDRKNINPKDENAKSRGVYTGIIMGALADIGILVYSTNQVFEQNYLPLAILGATNLASGIYELGRLSKSKQENLEMKAQKAEEEKIEKEKEPIVGGEGEGTATG